MAVKKSSKLLRERTKTVSINGEPLKQGRPKKGTVKTVITPQNEQEAIEITRTLCKQDFNTYIATMAPYAVMGNVHKEFAKFLEGTKGTTQYRLGLLPRGHRKSFLVAMYVCWRIVNNPAITILYISSTAGLAELQLQIIKQTLEGKLHQKIFPGLINPDEGKRKRWTTSEICVDHPLRVKEGVRDNTITAVGLTTTITGFHDDLIILDDLVEPNNDNATGRALVSSRYGQLQSILNAGGEIIAVGTRYNPVDLYNDLMNTYEDIFDESGNLVGRKQQWSVFQREVETNGEFLWPRTKRSDGKYFGYDMKELSRIKAGYLDKTQFYAQYYNNPNMAGASCISRDMFYYYEPDKLICRNGTWTYSGKVLNVFAAMDFAYTTGAHSDWTVLAVVGVDKDGIYYILSLNRFKTSKISDYHEAIAQGHNKYHFKKLRAEATAAQSVIVAQIKEALKAEGIRLQIEEYKPTKDKEERMQAILRPRYEEGLILHYRGGNCELLEEELVSARPEHDDLKDAVASAVDICVAPSSFNFMRSFSSFKNNEVRYGKFGGVL